MSYRTLEMGVQAIQAGNKVEGARFLRIALKSDELTPEVRAVGYLWLAETQDDRAHKRACYSEALAADPNNADAKARLTEILKVQLPPVPQSLPENVPLDTPPTPDTPYLPQSPEYTMVAPSAYMPPNFNPTPPTYSPIAPAYTPQGQGYTPYSADPSSVIVGVVGGPNGLGTGFFVTSDGLIATTRFVVGGTTQLAVEISPGRQIMAYVVRAFPDIDLAFLRTDIAPGTTLPVLPQPRLGDDTPLQALGYGRAPRNGAQRPTKRALPTHWIPTTFGTLDDAGGAPVFDQHQYLVGMMTRDTARNSGYFYALHIGMIQSRAQTYISELQGEPRAYCSSCGCGSRSSGAGFFYCEICGTVTPRAQQVQRYPLPQAEYYYGVSGMRCTRCGSQAGFYGARCLRCGQAPETRTL
jgi:hypothetical protein